MIHILGKRNAVRDAINVTSHSQDFGIAFSPFKLGPVDLYDGQTAKLMENAWQFAKVYPEHLDKDKQPNALYWAWAKAGWSSPVPQRYPMGKGAKPIYSWWEGKPLDYIQARKTIYCPLYSKLVIASPAWPQLQELYRTKTEAYEALYLWDFDGYDHGNMTYKEIINYDRRPMGHAFILAMLLDNQPVWLN